jgi:hypothetical protein
VPTTPGSTVTDSIVCRHGTGSKRIEVAVVAWNVGRLFAYGLTSDRLCSRTGRSSRLVQKTASREYGRRLATSTLCFPCIR